MILVALTLGCLGLGAAVSAGGRHWIGAFLAGAPLMVLWGYVGGWWLIESSVGGSDLAGLVFCICVVTPVLAIALFKFALICIAGNHGQPRVTTRPALGVVGLGMIAAAAGLIYLDARPEPPTPGPLERSVQDRVLQLSAYRVKAQPTRQIVQHMERLEQDPPDQVVDAELMAWVRDESAQSSIDAELRLRAAYALVRRDSPRIDEAVEALYAGFRACRTHSDIELAENRHQQLVALGHRTGITAPDGSEACADQPPPPEPLGDTASKPEFDDDYFDRPR